MKTKATIIMLLIANLIPACSLAQCTGGFFGGTLNFSNTDQTILVTGNRYYTFHADSGDRYFWTSQTIVNPGEITILDSTGTFSYAYDGTHPSGAFGLYWKAPYTGTFRALTNMRPCSVAPVVLGTIRYIYFPYIKMPEDSVQWSIRLSNSLIPFSRTTQYKMRGDTVIDNKVFNKIYSGIDLNYNAPSDTLHCFLREESRKWYVKYPLTSGFDTTELLLFDYNLQPGDTFNVRLFNYVSDSVFSFKLEHFAQFYTGNGMRLLHQMTPLNPMNVWGFTCEAGFYWIEGIGAFIGSFYMEIPQYACINYGSQTACFWDNGNYLIGGGVGCDWNTSIMNQSHESFVKIYPNPAKTGNQLFLPSSSSNTYTIQFYNTLGVLVYEVATDDNTIRLSDNLIAGIYFYRITGRDNSHFSGKLVVCD